MFINFAKNNKYNKKVKGCFLSLVIAPIFFAGLVVKSENILPTEKEIIIEELVGIEKLEEQEADNEVVDKNLKKPKEEIIESINLFENKNEGGVEYGAEENLEVQSVDFGKIETETVSSVVQPESNDNMGQENQLKDKEDKIICEPELVDNEVEVQSPPDDELKTENISLEIFSPQIFFSEIVIGDESGTKNEFIELYNFSDESVDLENFSLKKKTKSGSKSTLVSSKKFSGIIAPRGFFVISNQAYNNVSEADLTFSGSSYSIASDNRVYLEDSEGNLIDGIGWGKCEGDCEKGMIFTQLKEGQSLSRNEFEKPGHFMISDFEITNIKTPGETNIFSSKIKYPDNISFSEILANPDGIDKGFEWIELENKESKTVNFSGWIIENGSGSRFKIGNLKIGAGEFGVVRVIGTSFVVRNSNETLKLINPADKVISTVNIPGSSPSGVSFGLTVERGWGWNRECTPGSKNITNHLPKIKIKKQKNIYKNIYAIFDASKSSDLDRNDELKFTWDFGDGHKSYLKSTKHLYKKNGKYKVSLIVRDGFELVQKDFKIEVKSYPRIKLRFTQLLPNPKGKDKGNELIEIENLSSKKIDLLDFYIATGHKSSSTIRHKILEEFILKAHEKRFITNEKICLFSLLNKNGRVELLYPDGKKAFRVEYEKEKINEGDVFQLYEEKWKWIVFETPESRREFMVSDNSFDSMDEELMEKKIRDILNIITLNDDLGICETYLKMQIENWKSAQKRPITSLRKKMSIKNKFSLVSIF